MASIEDVARKAGVSMATVSRALRGRSGVSERTRERVQVVAAELRYTINKSASGLVTGRTGRVGVVVPFIGRWFFGQVIAGAEEVLRSAGLDVMLYAVGDVEARKRFFNELPLRRSVDAVLVLPFGVTEDEAEVLRELDVPLALVGSRAEGFLSVRIDDWHGASLAMRHLINLGHREIGLVYLGTQERSFLPPQARHAAYVDVLRSHGIGLREDLQADGGCSIAGGEQAMGELLAAEARPTAVFAESDEMAAGALRALRRHGLSAPRDVSVVGFDGHELAEFLDLTTVSQPVHEQGATAARMLLEQLAAGELSATRDAVLPVKLAVRGSTAALPETHGVKSVAAM